MTSTSQEEATAYYTGEVKALLHTCKHYLDKVVHAQTSDVHERNIHQINLTHQVERCQAWLDSGRTDHVSEWKKTRKLASDTYYFVGNAATWLQSIAIGNRIV
jgi:site-specific recombinase